MLTIYGFNLRRRVSTSSQTLITSSQDPYRVRIGVSVHELLHAANFLSVDIRNSRAPVVVDVTHRIRKLRGASQRHLPVVLNQRLLQVTGLVVLSVELAEKAGAIRTVAKSSLARVVHCKQNTTSSVQLPIQVLK